MVVSKNWATKLDKLLRSHNAFLPSFWRILTNTKTSVNSARAKATREAKAMRADLPKMSSYAFSEVANLAVVGSQVKKIETTIIKKTTTRLALIKLRVRSLPKTSVITSFIVKIKENTKMATLALSLNPKTLPIGKVLAPISSETAM